MDLEEFLKWLQDKGVIIPENIKSIVIFIKDDVQYDVWVLSGIDKKLQKFLSLFDLKVSKEQIPNEAILSVWDKAQVQYICWTGRVGNKMRLFIRVHFTKEDIDLV